MASSSYYKKKYKEKRKEAEDYKDKKGDINTILKNLRDSMGDEIRAVNNELDALKNDLDKSVRHDSVFSGNSNIASSKKESSIASDAKLSVAVSRLEDEVARLEKLRQQALEDEEYYYEKYLDAKEREREERERERAEKESSNSSEG